MRNIFALLFVLSLISSCSALKFFQKTDEPITQKKSIPSERYDKHITYWGKRFLQLNRKKRLRTSRRSSQYLKGLFDQLKTNNEIILKNTVSPTFHIMNDSLPYYFSLPDGSFIFSRGLILKYLKNEDLLATIVSYEMVKCLNLIYKRQIKIPTDDVNIKKMLKLTTVDYQERQEVRKLAFALLLRSGYDGSILLRWLQIRNRNTLDFSHYLQSGEEVIREEFSFKNFLMKQEVSSDKVISKNSSRNFYRFIDELKGI